MYDAPEEISQNFVAYSDYMNFNYTEAKGILILEYFEFPAQFENAS